MPKWFYLFILALALATAAGILRVDQKRQAWEDSLENQKSERCISDWPAPGDAHP